MKFGVIYSIEWDGTCYGTCPFEHGDMPEGLSLDLFEKTEDYEGGSDFFAEPKSAKFCSKELLTRKEFEKFLEYTQLHAEDHETMGSLIGWKWGLGNWAPAISFQDSGHGDGYFEDAYVTPVPDVPPKSFPEPEDDLEKYRIGQMRDAYMERCWQRVRRAVINMYGYGTMMPDYSTNDPKGWCGDPMRGAALGRPTIHSAPSDWDGEIRLRRVRINSGGYDVNGTYFGIGRPLYWYASDNGLVDAVLRANDRADAREQVLRVYPKVRIRR